MLDDFKWEESKSFTGNFQFLNGLPPRQWPRAVDRISVRMKETSNGTFSTYVRPSSAVNLGRLL